MVNLIFGLIFLAIPFMLMGLFSDKKKGFVYILFFLLLFQSVLGFLTQSMGIFYYWVVLSCTLTADIILIFVYFKIKFKNKKDFLFNPVAVDWIMLALIAISFLCLYQVHYNYMGQMSTASDQVGVFHKVENAKLPYPYYSDEWYAAGLAKDAINFHSLPTYNFLIKSRPIFINGEVFFHSLLAEIFLILKIDPVINYSAVSLFFNVLIVVLIYLFLRLNGVKKVSALIASLFIIYISSGANLPGIWYFIPIDMGIIFSIIGMCFITLKARKAAVLTGVLVFLFYPPCIIFYCPALILFLVKDISEFKKYIKYFVALVVLVFLGFYSLEFLPVLKNAILQKIFSISTYGKGIPQYGFFDVVPFYVTILAAIGILKFYKKEKMLLLQAIIGCLLWFFYSFSIYRLGIEYQRVVFYTSLILVMFSGFGLSAIENYLSDKKQWMKYFKYCQISAIVLFVIFIPFYTAIDNWENFLVLYPNGEVLYPLAPADEYLTQEDLKIFNGIKNKTFLSIPWKGTVIAVATGNYPIVTKEGNMTVGDNWWLDNFLKADCPGKINMAKSVKISYIYLYKFDCPGFEAIEKSKEGFVLYRVN